MSMMLFHQLLPEMGLAETRSVTVVEETHGLPDDSYGFMELYCVEADCDCRRVLINVLSERRRAHLATINHGFDVPSPKDLEPEQTFLDPLNVQSRWSKALLALFEDVLRDPDYSARLERHYQMVKDALADPSHPIHAFVRSAEDSSAARPAAEVDPYTPCPCGSGNKYKWCCGLRA